MTDPRASSFSDFFKVATGGFTPYRWQVQVALDGLPDVLPVPTGLGKTEVALAWAWRRLVDNQPVPLHLVICLPMRSLVTQTVRAANEQQFEWPLAKDRRAHVHGTIASYERPITHVTRRMGARSRVAARGREDVHHAEVLQGTETVIVLP